jgi:tRNA 2-thiouridine synthesizing protein A
MSEIAFDLEMDTQGLMCPEPIMMLHGKVREMESGQVLRVLATDPATTRDIPQFCNFLNHELVAEDHSDKLYVYYIKKG